MKTKLLKRLRKNYSIIEEVRGNGVKVYKWKHKYCWLVVFLLAIIFPINIFLFFVFMFTNIDLSEWQQGFYYDTISGRFNSKQDALDNFIEERIAVFTEKRKARRIRIRARKVVSKKVVWY